MGLFGVNNALISLLLSFKATKAKKAAIIAGKAKLKTGKFVLPKILSEHPEELLNYLLLKIGQ